MIGGTDNQATIKRKTKIKQKHKLNDPTLLQTNPILVPQVGTTNLTTTSGLTKNRSSSSSSSSSSNQGQQKPGMGTTVVEGLTGTTQMGQGSMGPGLSNQGYTQGMQNYPNTGITGTGMGPMPVNQQGELPSTKTMAKNEAKVTLVQKVKDKILHHGEK